MNQSDAARRRKGLVRTTGAPTCPSCGRRLEFGSDRLGRTTQFCRCGHESYVGVRRRPAAPPTGHVPPK